MLSFWEKDAYSASKAYLATQNGVQVAVLVSKLKGRFSLGKIQEIMEKQRKGKLLDHVVKIISVIQTIYPAVLILEYGPITLEKYIRRVKKLPSEEEKQKIGYLLCQHIDAAYDSIEKDGWTYTDSNPANMVKIGTTLKFIDLDSLQHIGSNLEMQSARREALNEIEGEFGIEYQE